MKPQTQKNTAMTTNSSIFLDSTPEQLPVRLVNAYLDIKRSGRL